jgi:hypothetical protein
LPTVVSLRFCWQTIPSTAKRTEITSQTECVGQACRADSLNQLARQLPPDTFCLRMRSAPGHIPDISRRVADGRPLANALASQRRLTTRPRIPGAVRPTYVRHQLATGFTAARAARSPDPVLPKISDFGPAPTAPQGSATRPGLLPCRRYFCMASADLRPPWRDCGPVSTAPRPVPDQLSMSPILSSILPLEALCRGSGAHRLLTWMAYNISRSSIGGRSHAGTSATTSPRRHFSG